MHEDRRELAVVVRRLAAHAPRHVVQRMQRLVEIAGRRVLAVEDRQVLEVAVQLAADDVAQHGLAEIDGAIRRRAADVLEMDVEQRRIALDEHRDGAGALRRLAGAAARVLGDVGADDDRAAILGLEGQVAQRVLQRVDAAQARVLDLGDLAMARQRRAAARLQALVEHAFDDDGAGGVVGARLGAEPQEPDPVGVDVVAVDEPHDGRGGHRIDALRGAAHPEAMADDGAGLVPNVVGPATPRLEVYAVRWHVDGKAADTHFVGHRTPSSALVWRRCLGATVSLRARLYDKQVAITLAEHTGARRGGTPGRLERDSAGRMRASSAKMRLA